MKNVFFLLILIVLTCCDQDLFIRLDETDFDKKIVVDGLLVDGFPFYTLLYTNYGYSEDQSDSQDHYHLKNAQVLLFQNGQLLDTISQTTEYPPRFEWYGSWDDTVRLNYYESQKKLIPSSGKEYKIEIRAEGFPTATASAQKMGTIDLKNYFVDSSTYANEAYNRAWIEVNDPSDEKNYYFIQAQKYDEDYENKNESMSLAYIPDNSISTTDKAYTNPKKYSVLVFTDEDLVDGRYHFFTRELADYLYSERLQERKLQELEDKKNGGSLENTMTITLNLQHISEETFYFIRDTDPIKDPTPFSEPTFVQGNIKNGLGLFSLPGESSLEILRMEDYTGEYDGLFRY